MRRSRHRVPLAIDDVEDAFVLPRPLRRAVRFLVSLGSGRINIPAHTGTVSVLALFAATGLYGMSIGGHSQAVAEATTSAAGFAIEDVKVSGNDETSEIEILQLLGLDGTTSLVALDADAARLKIANLPWVENVEVRKVYPRAVEVKLTERKAYAIWQHGSELSLIQKDGSVIAPLRDNKFAKLPLFVGRDAETAAASVEDEFAKWPDIRGHVKAFVRVAGRRWDLYLDNGVIIKLPEDNIDGALARLTKLDKDENLLERDIAAVDLRLDDRTAIELTPDAAVRRQAAVDARNKALKKAGQDT
ncbi:MULTISPECIES: cell division protein FtsQ/DivIB [unclassified Rhizobium]|uniref:cell division protein FtsQ/DivIB n=1 Tax=unclassified Rhizobium TaxID=2613769 RepID=UPI00161C482B|nr:MULTISPECIES: cell division protein FtsQ/DivIB [unclassified Rhizobium]MBB3285876.1 cell division protein FtsQ [Rhizobium sp. BK252]MBB3400962.1 cell division protein FtsQ [Rhizobium sp. BK289]MBB3413194.1 cell division protein FtsQ [Rhizobium sp. BK284]MBB3481428.1 cell division protein FtsQ [Rhizobium sp. BK347]MDK4723258.1 cell division protein FtsQ/DivIB [Rhizobium sp. CNPSo 3968]